MAREMNWSYGGGVNSVALAVAVRRGLLPRPDRIVFADTGREGSPALRYLDEHVRPMLAEIGLSVEVAPHDLATVDVYSKKGELLIPAFTAGGGRMQTFCSTEWKTRVIHRYLRSQGVRECVTWLGFSTEEAHRIKPSQVKWQTYHWPLALDLGWNRATCHGMIAEYGLPPAPKSACWMCPNHSNAEWRRVRETPEDWKRAVAFDKAIRARDKYGGVFVHASGKPLDEANIDEDNRPGLWDDCGNVCWT